MLQWPDGLSSWPEQIVSPGPFSSHYWVSGRNQDELPSISGESRYCGRLSLLWVFLWSIEVFLSLSFLPSSLVRKPNVVTLARMHSRFPALSQVSSPLPLRLCVPPLPRRDQVERSEYLGRRKKHKEVTVGCCNPARVQCQGLRWNSTQKSHLVNVTPTNPSETAAALWLYVIKAFMKSRNQFSEP